MRAPERPPPVDGLEGDETEEEADHRGDSVYYEATRYVAGSPQRGALALVGGSWSARTPVDQASGSATVCTASWSSWWQAA